MGFSVHVSVPDNRQIGGASVQDRIPAGATATAASLLLKKFGLSLLQGFAIWLARWGDVRGLAQPPHPFLSCLLGRLDLREHRRWEGLGGEEREHLGLGHPAGQGAEVELEQVLLRGGEGARVGQQRPPGGQLHGGLPDDPGLDGGLAKLGVEARACQVNHGAVGEGAVRAAVFQARRLHHKVVAPDSARGADPPLGRGHPAAHQVEGVVPRDVLAGLEHGLGEHGRDAHQEADAHLPGVQVGHAAEPGRRGVAHVLPELGAQLVEQGLVGVLLGHHLERDEIPPQPERERERELFLLDVPVQGVQGLVVLDLRRVARRQDRHHVTNYVRPTRRPDEDVEGGDGHLVGVGGGDVAVPDRGEGHH
mmetsp:Transcript_23194/g.52310  ORF Transcript_23194/g.52310 Transcript_23194/m.52310 type:complete len:364 (-) Transcript_23194:104-1195(-)